MTDERKSQRALLIAVLLLIGACGSQAQDQSSSAREKSKALTPDYGSSSKTAPPPKPLSADAAAPTGEPEKDKEKEKRGNTPPGTDRSGGGPASGAIVDPSGVTQK